MNVENFILNAQSTNLLTNFEIMLNSYYLVVLKSIKGPKSNFQAYFEEEHNESAKSKKEKNKTSYCR